METDFRALLAGDVAIIRLVAGRIYPAAYAQNAADPCVRYQKISGSIGLHMQGSDGLSTDLMQIDVRAAAGSSGEGAAKALAIRDALVALLHGYRGLVGSTQFQLIALRDDRGVQFETSGAKSYYTTSLDFDVYSRAAA